MFDLVIKNGTIIDGTGKPPKTLDLGIREKEIIKIGNLKSAFSKETINAKKYWVTPGFIDVQNHSDSFWTIFDYPHQESLLSQGITTIVLGNCGASLAPLPSHEALKSVQKWHFLDGINFNWQYFDEFLKELAKQELGVNVLSLIGHSTIRRGLLGDEVRKVTVQEQKILDRLTVSSFKNGAFGLSIGLIYAHEYDATYEELLSLARIVRQADGVLSIHLRSEGANIEEALSEILKLAEDSEARMKISHFKISGQRNWHKFENVINLIERAYQKGIQISFDVYPYTTTWSVLYTYLPKWAAEGGRIELVKRLHQPYLRSKIVDNLKQQKVDLSNITVATSTSSPHLVGKKLGEIAGDHGVSVEEALVNILSAAESEVIVFDETISFQQMTDLIQHPLSMVASDGAGFGLEAERELNNLVHPRCFGAMTRFLKLIMAKKLLSPEKAVYKITGLPASLLKIPKRGVLKNGNRADIVIIDPKKVRDFATIQNPFQTSQGISAVIVNGTLCIKDGKFLNGLYTGEVIRR